MGRCYENVIYQVIEQPEGHVRLVERGRFGGLRHAEAAAAIDELMSEGNPDARFTIILERVSDNGKSPDL